MPCVWCYVVLCGVVWCCVPAMLCGGMILTLPLSPSLSLSLPLKSNVNICCIPTHEFPGLGPQGANVGGRGRIDDGSWQVFGMWSNKAEASSPPNLVSFTIPADLSVMEGHWFHGSRTPKPWKLVKDNYLQLGIHKDYTSR